MDDLKILLPLAAARSFLLLHSSVRLHIQIYLNMQPHVLQHCCSIASNAG
jgi:hypothetical protein